MTLIDWWTDKEREVVNKLHDEIEALYERHDKLPEWRWIKRAGIEHRIAQKRRELSIRATEADYAAWHNSFKVKRQQRGEL